MRRILATILAVGLMAAPLCEAAQPLVAAARVVTPAVSTQALLLPLITQRRAGAARLHVLNVPWLWQAWQALGTPGFHAAAPHAHTLDVSSRLFGADPWIGLGTLAIGMALWNATKAEDLFFVLSDFRQDESRPRDYLTFEQFQLAAGDPALVRDIAAFATIALPVLSRVPDRVAIETSPRIHPRLQRTEAFSNDRPIVLAQLLNEPRVHKPRLDVGFFADRIREIRRQTPPKARAAKERLYFETLLELLLQDYGWTAAVHGGIEFRSVEAKQQSLAELRRFRADLRRTLILRTPQRTGKALKAIDVMIDALDARLQTIETRLDADVYRMAIPLEGRRPESLAVQALTPSAAGTSLLEVLSFVETVVSAEISGAAEAGAAAWKAQLETWQSTASWIPEFATPVHDYLLARAQSRRVVAGWPERILPALDWVAAELERKRERRTPPSPEEEQGPGGSASVRGPRDEAPMRFGKATQVSELLAAVSDLLRAQPAWPAWGWFAHERAVLARLPAAQGMSERELSQSLGVSPSSLRTSLRAIELKLRQPDVWRPDHSGRAHSPEESAALVRQACLYLYAQSPPVKVTPASVARFLGMNEKTMISFVREHPEAMPFERATLPRAAGTRHPARGRETEPPPGALAADATSAPGRSVPARADASGQLLLDFAPAGSAVRREEPHSKESEARPSGPDVGTVLTKLLAERPFLPVTVRSMALAMNVLFEDVVVNALRLAQLVPYFSRVTRTRSEAELLQAFDETPVGSRVSLEWADKVAGLPRNDALRLMRLHRAKVRAWINDLPPSRPPAMELIESYFGWPAGWVALLLTQSAWLQDHWKQRGGAEVFPPVDRSSDATTSDRLRLPKPYDLSFRLLPVSLDTVEKFDSVLRIRGAEALQVTTAEGRWYVFPVDAGHSRPIAERYGRRIKKILREEGWKLFGPLNYRNALSAISRVGHRIQETPGAKGLVAFRLRPQRGGLEIVWRDTSDIGLKERFTALKPLLQQIIRQGGKYRVEASGEAGPSWERSDDDRHAIATGGLGLIWLPHPSSSNDNGNGNGRKDGASGRHALAAAA